MKILITIAVLVASLSLFAQEDEKVKIKTGLKNHISSKVTSVKQRCESTSIDLYLQAAQVVAQERENISITYKYTFIADEVVEIYDLKTTKSDGSKVKEKVNVRTVNNDNQVRSKSFNGYISGTILRDGEWVEKNEALMLVEGIALDKAKRDECESSRKSLKKSIK